MSVFESIMAKVLHGPGSMKAGPGQATAPPQATPGVAPPGAQQATAVRPPKTVDVEAVLDEMSVRKGKKLDWRHSIVDLLKLLDLDSSMSARKELARELRYSGDLNDSSNMNIWLHRQVMRHLAENGGAVPESLKH